MGDRTDAPTQGLISKTTDAVKAHWQPKVARRVVRAVVGLVVLGVVVLAVAGPTTLAVPRSSGVTPRGPAGRSRCNR